MVLRPSCLVPVDAEFPRLRTTLFLQLGSFLTQTAFILPRKQREMGIQFHLRWEMEQNTTARGGWERRTSARAQNQRQTEKFPKSLQNLLCSSSAPQNQPQKIYRALSKRVLVVSHCPPLPRVDVDKTSHGISGRPLDPSPLRNAAPTCGSRFLGANLSIATPQEDTRPLPPTLSLAEVWIIPLPRLG